MARATENLDMKEATRELTTLTIAESSLRQYRSAVRSVEKFALRVANKLPKRCLSDTLQASTKLAEVEWTHQHRSFPRSDFCKEQRDYGGNHGQTILP